VLYGVWPGQCSLEDRLCPLSASAFFEHTLNLRNPVRRSRGMTSREHHRLVSCVSFNSRLLPHRRYSFSAIRWKSRVPRRAGEALRRDTDRILGHEFRINSEQFECFIFRFADMDTCFYAVRSSSSYSDRASLGFLLCTMISSQNLVPNVFSHE
jgi:hypothetical protein